MSTALNAHLEFHEIQGIVLNGYGHLDHSRFIFLKIADAQAARRWLRGVSDRISSAKRRGREDELPGSQANIGFTLSGLEKLGVPRATLNEFPREFQMGMASPERSRKLGDVGASAPEGWQFGGPNSAPFDCLLMLYSRDKATLDHVMQRDFGGPLASDGLEEVIRQNSERKGSNEPFGFRDGISQPGIQGSGQKAVPGQTIIKAGEFLLGHVDEYGDVTPAPAIASEVDPGGILARDSSRSGHRSFGYNGSFLVFRKLAQDVGGFHRFLDEAACNADGSKNPERAKLLSAKMIGRWPSGAPLTLAPDKDDPRLGASKYHNNAFGFAASDPNGFACPVGAHIRRANPRDALAFPADPHRSLQIANRHRIIRRGRPYHDNSPAGGAPPEQGLLFMAVNATFHRQFEFIQQSWLNNPKFNGLYEERDPLNSVDAGGGMITIPAKPVRERIRGLPRFVTVRGGGYFFLPSIRALNFLASLG